MKAYFLVIFIWVANLSVGFAQQNPYESLKSTLGDDQVNPSVLFPLEMDGVKILEAKVDYRFPFEEGKSDLVISMNEFTSMESAVFFFEKTDKIKLIEAFDAGTAERFTVDFEKNGPQNFCRLISSKQNPNEAYLLVGNQKQAELLKIVYPKNSKKMVQSLKVKLENSLN